MSAHTPGPWHWSVGKFVAADDGQLVADTQTVADARLIAAAPALLEFAQEYLARLDVTHANDELAFMARAAIAQAKGETV